MMNYIKISIENIEKFSLELDKEVNRVAPVGMKMILGRSVKRS